MGKPLKAIDAVAAGPKGRCVEKEKNQHGKATDSTSPKEAVFPKVPHPGFSPCPKGIDGVLDAQAPMQEDKDQGDPRKPTENASRADKLKAPQNPMQEKQDQSGQGEDGVPFSHCGAPFTEITEIALS